MQTVFRSTQMANLVKMAKTAASSAASVFITGENGVGKEHIARILHDEGPRNKDPFVAVNCAALPRDLIESELFGSKHGAYTGSVSDRRGLFREADSGTIFLDEIADMPIEMQSKLLRVLQDKQVRPVGDTKYYPLMCRVIAATNRPIDDALQSHRLRTDLYYRLAVISLHLPALRERPEDIEALSYYFFDKFSTEENKEIEVDKSVIPMLSKGYWEGNVRQLQNAIHQAVIFADKGNISVTSFNCEVSRPTSTLSQPLPVSNDYNLEKMTIAVITQAMSHFSGNKRKVASALGVNRGTLYAYLKKFGFKDIDEVTAVI